MEFSQKQNIEWDFNYYDFLRDLHIFHGFPKALTFILSSVKTAHRMCGFYLTTEGC